MRFYIDFVSGEISAEWPFKKGGVLESVKALTGEEVEIRFTKDGVPVSLGSGVLPKLQVRETKGAGLLAELTSFTAPTEVSTGFYTGVLSFNTTAVQELLAAHPERASFAAVAAVFWTVSSLDRESDDLALNLLRRVGASGEDPLVLLTPWDWLKARLVAGSNVTLTANEEAETLSIAAAGGAWNDITGKPSTFPPSSHTHAQSEVTGLEAALAGKASSSHTHAIADTTGLQAALDSKAAASHTHAIADTSGLQTALDGKAASSHTHAISNVTGLQAALDGKAAATHTHAIGDLPVASQAEAEAGADTTKVMTPQRVAQAIAAQASGNTLVRGSGLLQGHTDAGEAASPAEINQGTNSSGIFYPGDSIRIYHPSASYDVSFEFVNDTSGTLSGAVLINIAGVLYDLSSQFSLLINAIVDSGFAGSLGYDPGSNVFQLMTTDSGSSVTLTFEYNYDGGDARAFSAPINTTATGTDSLAPSGAITEVTIIPQDGFKTIKPVNVLSVGPGIPQGVEISLKVENDHYPICRNHGLYYYGNLLPLDNFWNEWITGRASAALVARMTGEAPVGGSLRIVALVEQI